MNKRKNKRIKTIVTTGTIKDFFDRGKNISRSLDAKNKINTRKRIISFEDPKDLLRFISDKKMTLMKLIREQPDSVTALAKFLKRERSSVDRDIRILESYGLVKTHYENNPGHGKYKIVEPVSRYPVEIRAAF